ncbi:MAG TPA: MerR family transcriptional regulator [Acidimicrobiales bacterium]|jgi:DNA-binding transcriptional MerR regulator|nr:MerR family transcriptional regulator [Acidimicrobiales bacterium]
MSARSTRTYLSIGEVLSLLRVDFPDVTISKIRFLEGQGLVSPERTSSGYRKFHDPDVEQLRFVLRHQREHFLPLKVIRERMEEAGLAPAAPTKPPGARRRSVSELVAALQESPPAKAAAPGARPAAASPARPEAPAPDPVEDPAPGRPAAPVVTAEEVAAAAGLEVAAIEALVEHGLVVTVRQGGVDGFDEDGVAVAKAAAGFLALGIEPRHLKVLQHGVLREMDIIETRVRPLLQQRTPEARVRAREEATQFARLGQSLRAAMLRRELRRTIG